MTTSRRPLAAHGCRTLCSWSPTGLSHGGEPLFRCSGCASEWVPSEPWTPVDVDGTVAPAVQRVRRL